MFGYYVRLRLRSGGRLLKELGIVRSMLLVGLLAFAVAILCKVEASWILPLVCLLVIGGYHQTRKDRDFLRRFTDDVSLFFLCEYLLLSYGIHPDVPSYGLVIPYYNKYIGIGMSARQCTGGKGRHVALGRYPVGCLQLRA